MRFLIYLSCCLGIASAAVGGDDCGYRWSDRYGTYDFNGSRPSAAQVFDEDGDGPRLPVLFVGGSFLNMSLWPGPSIEGTRNIARWDGARWTSVGGGAPSYVGTIFTMKVFDEDGPGPEPDALYVAPTLTGGCAKWDGAVWADCSYPGMPSGYEITHLAVIDGDGVGPNLPVLIAAARCTTLGCFKGRVFQLVNNAWSQMGGQFNDYLFDLESFDPDGDGPTAPRLIVAGGFDNVAPPFTPVENVAQWDGSAWLPLGAGTNSHVHDLLVCDADDDGPQPTKLYASGRFTMAGGISANYIASWDGANWAALGTGVDASNPSLAFYKPPNSAGHLYALGDFRYAGGVDARPGFARWNGAAWERVYEYLPNTVDFRGFGPGSGISSVCEFDPDGPGPRATMLYVIGTDFFVPNNSRAPETMGAWDGESWHYLASGISYWTAIEQMVAYDTDGDGPLGNSMVAAGYFTTAGDSNARGLASWRDGAWVPFDLGSEFTIEDTNGPFRAIGLWDSDGPGPRPRGPVVLGDFHSDDYSIRSLTYWSGDAWQPIVQTYEDEGLIDEARFVISWDHDGDSSTTDYLVFGGDCYGTLVLGRPVVVIWTGSEWRDLGQTYVDCGSANTVIPVDRDGAGGQPPVLFVGASGPIFQDFDAQEFLHYLGWWDEARWQPLGLPPNGEVLVLLYDDPDGAGPSQGTLYVGGRFTEIGGITANRIAAYDFDTETWRALGSIGSEGYLSVNALAIFDEDEVGPLPPYLVAGGYFDVADGMQVNSIAKWDGTSWSDLDNGILSSGTGTSIGQVSSLAVLPGTQSDPYPKLFVGGYMERAGDVGSRNIACWTKARPPEAVMLSSDTIVTAGSRVVLRASALGDDPITYQWRRNGVPLSDDARITGSDKAILRIANVDRPDEGSYDVVATNDCSESVSTAASLIVPCFTARPDGDLSGDGQLDGRDIQLMVDHLIANTQTTAVVCRVDFDNSRRLDLGDIVPFAEKLLAP